MWTKKVCPAGPSSVHKWIKIQPEQQKWNPLYCPKKGKKGIKTVTSPNQTISFIFLNKFSVTSWDLLLAKKSELSEEQEIMHWSSLIMQDKLATRKILQNY